MTEKVLAYDAGIVPQEKSWDCGPASTQVVLNGRSVFYSEDDLTRRIGTDEDGTDYVGLIEPVLNGFLPEAQYSSVYIENDPPTAAQGAQLWADIRRSIDAGYGVVMNWVAPPSNYPRGVKGSSSPTYGGGTVFHYVACMGYDDEARAVFIADPGFQPHGYWISFDQCASLIPPKGYAAAHPVGATEPPAPPADPAQILSDAMGGRLSLDNYRELLPAVSEALQACEATTVDRIAMWVAQIGHESAGLYYTEEIADGWAYEGRADLGNTYPGDGPRFKGRSWIQITGRSNYTRLSQWAFENGLVPSPTFFVDYPEKLADDAGLGAAWYWVIARPDINALSDARDLDSVTERINGGLNGIEDRQVRYNNALAMGSTLLSLIGLTEGEDDDMASWTPDLVDRAMVLLENIAGVSRPSLSPLRHLGEGNVNTCAGFAWSADGLTHPQFVLTAAKAGHAESIRLLAEIAGADLSRYPDRAGDKDLAAALLRSLDPSVLKTYLETA